MFHVLPPERTSLCGENAAVHHVMPSDYCCVVHTTIYENKAPDVPWCILDEKALALHDNTYCCCSGRVRGSVVKPRREKWQAVKTSGGVGES